MNNYYNYMNFEPNLNLNKSNPSVGFERGNLFDSLYDPYKNYKPEDLNPKGDKEYLMYQIQMYSFALNELNLYLDNYPNDTDAINLRSKYLREYQEAFNQYENRYGALGVNSDVLNKTPWGWIMGTPWEGDKNV